MSVLARWMKSLTTRRGPRDLVTSCEGPHTLRYLGVVQTAPLSAQQRVRPRKTTIRRFSISPSGRLWPFLNRQILNRQILNVGPPRLGFRSVGHDQIEPISERTPRRLIVLQGPSDPLAISSTQRTASFLP